jgi:hypothetical protein
LVKNTEGILGVKEPMCLVLNSLSTITITLSNVKLRCKYDNK